VSTGDDCHDHTGDASVRGRHKPTGHAAEEEKRGGQPGTASGAIAPDERLGGLLELGWMRPAGSSPSPGSAGGAPPCWSPRCAVENSPRAALARSPRTPRAAGARSASSPGFQLAGAYPRGSRACLRPAGGR
jgi:hypothetical protein